MKIQRFLSALLVFCMLASIVPFPARAAEIASGTLSETITWKIDGEGTLTISGEGDMPDDESPWDVFASQITTIVVQEGITSIGRCSFQYCNKVISISLPESLTSIGLLAFYFCESLETILIPQNVTDISVCAFKYCYNLQKINVEKGNARYYSVNGVLFDSIGRIEETALTLHTYPAGKSKTTYSIPDGVVIVDNSAFFGAQIKGIDIPESVVIIEHEAFSGSHLATVSVPDTVAITGDGIFGECTYLESASLPDNIALGNGTFHDCTNLKDVKWPSNLPVIPVSTFSGCLSLETLNIPQCVEIIGDGAFEQCQNLSHLELPDKLRTIGVFAFSGCKSLKKLDIPDTVDNLGYGTFNSCINLEHIMLPKKLSGIPERLFFDCVNLQRIDIPDGTTYIEFEAFYNCDKLASLSIPQSVTKLGYHPFSDCDNLNSIFFYGNPPSFSEDTFYGFSGTVYYPDTNSMWTSEVMQDYEGDPTWVPYHSHDYSHSEPVFNPDSKTHTLTCACGLSKAEACTFTEEILKEATLETFGIKRYTCTVCGGTFEGHYVYRIAGENRFETAFKVADQMKENLGIEKFDSVIIASGANFADALSGSYLASVKNAPILLSYKAAQNEQVQAYIKANLAEGGTVYILGGTSAVPADMESGLAGINVVRLDGANRFETNLMILKEAGVKPGQEILVCTSTNFADSLSASATGLPILLVYNEKSRLTDDQLAYLGSLSGNSFRIIGGENAVSPTLEAAIAAYGSVARLAGANRFATSVMVAETYFDAPEYAVLAYAWNYPDGLCGGPLAYSMDAPLILTMTKYEAAAAAYTEESGIERGIVLGGTGLISDDAVRNIFPNISKPQ